MNWGLIEGLLKFNLALIGGFALMHIYFDWALNLPGPWSIVVIVSTMLLLANIATYFTMESQRKHIEACKKKGIKPTILYPW